MKILKLAFLFAFGSIAAQNNYNLIIGTYAEGCTSKGIYLYDFNVETTEHEIRSTTGSDVINPSFITVTKDNKFLYSVNQDGFDSTVSAFNYVAESAELKFLNKIPSQVSNPSYIITDGKNIFTPSYKEGSINILGRNQKGEVSAEKQLLDYYDGSGINRERQQSSHLGMLQITPDGKHAIAADLGADKIYIYVYNPEGGSKTLHLKETVKMKEGSGPRDFVFSADGKKLYLLNGLNGTVTVFNYALGKLTKIAETSVLSKDFSGNIDAIGIKISTDGKFIYTANKADSHTISVLEIKPDGSLNWVQEIHTEGKSPNHFTIDPTGNLLLVANTETNDIAIFNRDKATGKLTYMQRHIEVCSPTFLMFAKGK